MKVSAQSAKTILRGIGAPTAIIEMVPALMDLTWSKPVVFIEEGCERIAITGTDATGANVSVLVTLRDGFELPEGLRKMLAD
jgi:hypothetical protein